MSQEAALQDEKVPQQTESYHAANEPGRGREAQKPTQIPPRGWKDIVVRSARGIASKNLGIVSAGCAFYALLAIFPALAALVSIYGLIANPSDVQSLIDITGRVIPGDANKLLANEMTALVQKPSSGLSFGAILGFGFALWSAHGGITTMMTALNIAYGETERRGYIRRNLLGLGLTMGAVVFIIITLSLIALLPAVIAFLPLTDDTRNFVALIRWPILIVLVMVALAILYRYGPSRHHAKWRWLGPGAIITTLLWVVGSAAFSYYVSRFATYDKTYGSLGAVIVLLMWLYITSYLILIGAEINAEAEHQTVHDTTIGAPKPLGERNAFVADTIGVATNKRG